MISLLSAITLPCIIGRNWKELAVWSVLIMLVTGEIHEYEEVVNYVKCQVAAIREEATSNR